MFRLLWLSLLSSRAASSASRDQAPPPTWTWSTRFASTTSSNAASVPAASLSSVPLTVQAVQPAFRYCDPNTDDDGGACTWEKVVPQSVIGYNTDQDEYFSAQALGAHAAYFFYTGTANDDPHYYGTLVAVSLGPQVDDDSRCTPSNRSACLTAFPLGTVLMQTDVPTPARCKHKQGDDDIMDDDGRPHYPCGGIIHSPDLILASLPSSTSGEGSAAAEQVAITVSITGDDAMHSAYVITAFNISTPYSGPPVDPTQSPPALWSYEQPIATTEDKWPVANIRLLQVGADTVAVLASTCLYIRIDLFNVSTGSKTGTGRMQMSDEAPPDCGSLTLGMGIAGTEKGYIAATVTPNGLGSQQNVVAGRVSNAANGSLTVQALWSTNEGGVCGGVLYSCAVDWPYSSLLFDEERGILLRYCVNNEVGGLMNGCLGALNATTGDILWEQLMPTTAVSLSLATGPGVVTASVNTINPVAGFVPDGAYTPNVTCLAFNISTGDVLWSWPWNDPLTLYGWSLVDGQGRMLVEKQVLNSAAWPSQAMVSFLSIDARTGVVLEESVPYLDTYGGNGMSSTDFGFKGMPFQLSASGRIYGWLAGVPNPYSNEDDDESGTGAGIAVLQPLRPSPSPSPSSTPLPLPSPTPGGGPSDGLPAGVWHIPVAASLGSLAVLSIMASGLWCFKRARYPAGRAEGARGASAYRALHADQEEEA